MALYHLKKGSVTYTVVGAPTIVDGVVSGFSTSNRLNLPSLADFNAYELFIKFTTGELSNTDTMSVFGTSSQYSRYGVNISTNKQVNSSLRYSLNGTIYTLTSSISGFAVSPNQTYYVRVVLQANNYQISISPDNEHWTVGTSASIPAGAQLLYPTTGSNHAGQLRIGAGTQYLPFAGSIDLNSTYIKVNGQPWLGVCPLEVQNILLNNQEVKRLVVNDREVWRKEL